MLPPPVGQYNDFVFTSESEMESGNNGMHTTHWKHGLKRHHQLEVKTERNNSCDTPSPGISPNAAAGHHHHHHHNLMGDKVKRRKSDDGTSVSSSMQESNDAPCSSSMECGIAGGGGGGGGGSNATATGHGAGASGGGGGGSRKKNSIRSQLAQQMLNSSTRVLKKPQYVVRPMPSSGSTSLGGSGISNGASNGINNGGGSGTEREQLQLAVLHCPAMEPMDTIIIITISSNSSIIISITITITIIIMCITIAAATVAHIISPWIRPY